MITNSSVTAAMLGCHEISSDKEISPLVFIFAPGKFGGQGQKSVTFVAKISRECSLAQLPVVFTMKLFELDLPCFLALSATVF